MAEPKIVGYIRNSLEKGISIDEIIRRLKLKDWPDYMISDAVKEAQENNSQFKVSLKRKRFSWKSLIKYLIFLLIILDIIYSAQKIIPMLSA